MNLEEYYNKFNEDKRLDSVRGQVEYLTSMKYIRECLKSFENPRIIDIGAGTGSVSVELALIARNGKVWAFERNPEAVELIKTNKNRFAVRNLEIVEGEASAEIKIMPAPDSVFIGGSGGNLHSMLDTIYGKNKQALTYFFFFFTPNNSLPIFWYEKDSEWECIFPR